jgi:hypothetical protein
VTVTGSRILTTRSGSVNEQWARTYTLRYLVETNNPHDGWQIVRNSPLVPQVGYYYNTTGESDFGARATNVEGQHVQADPKLWHVDVTFTSAQREDPEDQDTQDPEQRKPTISVRFERMQVAIFDEDDETPIGNSLKQPFSPPPMKEETRAIISIVRNERDINLANVQAWQDRVNDAEFAGAATKTLKLNITNIQEMFREGERFWTKTYELAYRAKTWTQRIMDAGYKQDEDGNFRLIALNGSGQEVAALADVHFFTIEPYEALNFGTVSGIQELDQGEGFF